MLLNHTMDQIITAIHELDRQRCIQELRAIRRPRLDFTDEFLEPLSLDQLRHILLAACIQARRHEPTNDSAA